MLDNAGFDIPLAELKRVEFLIGESAGRSTLVPPDRSPIQFMSHLTVSREACERFFRIEFYAEVPDVGIESVHALLTYSKKQEAYVLWCFMTSKEDPLVLVGNFHGDTLALVSGPSEMLWGLQKMRVKFRPLTDGAVDCVAELWTIDGYTPYFHATYVSESVNVA